MFLGVWVSWNFKIFLHLRKRAELMVQNFKAQMQNYNSFKLTHAVPIKKEALVNEITPFKPFIMKYTIF